MKADAFAMPFRRPRVCGRYVCLFALIFLVTGAPAARAQTVQAVPASPSLDRRLLVGVYHVEAPAFRYAMRAAHATARPVFYAAPVAAWGAAWLLREDPNYADAYRLTVSEVAAYGLAAGLKRWTDRPRPYAAVPGIASRSGRYRDRAPGLMAVVRRMRLEQV